MWICDYWKEFEKIIVKVKKYNLNYKTKIIGWHLSNLNLMVNSTINTTRVKKKVHKL